MKKPGKTPQRPQRRSRLQSFFRFCFILVLVCVTGAGTYLGYCYQSSRTVKTTVDTFFHTGLSPAAAFNTNSYTLLIIGRDHDTDDRDRVLKTKGRADSILLAHLDFAQNQANILSIPRDTLVRIPGYRGKRKINSAHALGGPELMSDTLESLLGVHPDGSMVIDFDGFAKAVDTLGGLRIAVDKQLDYDDNWGNLHIHLKPGVQLLNGQQAMGYVRYRHANAGGGDSDLERIKRQQAFVTATKMKLSQPASFMQLPAALDNIRDHLSGDLSTEQIICLGNFLRTLPRSSIRYETLPATEGRVYVKADIPAARELVREMFKS